MENTCPNCHRAISNENFCPDCGQALKIDKIDGKYVVQELFHLVGYEKGFIFTFKELLLRPGKIIREYLHENRGRIIKPVTFLILASVVYSLVNHYFKTDEVYDRGLKKFYGESSVFYIMQWIQNNYGYANLIMILPITLWVKLLFRKHKYNLYEIFVVISFIMGAGMIIFCIQPVLTVLFPDSIALISNLVSFFIFAYIAWGIGQFYESKFTNYLKAFIAYWLGFFTFQVLAVFIGIFYDLMTRG